MKIHRSTGAILALAAPLALLAACGGGGHHGSSTTGSDPGSPLESVPESVNNSISTVPVVGSAIADCSPTGVGVIDQVVTTVNSSAPLPQSLPTLSSLLSGGSSAAQSLPVLGGLVPNGSGGLTLIPGSDALSMLSTSSTPLGSLPVPGQLQTVCSGTEIPSAPSGDPTAALGVIPIFGSSGDPVGVLIATVPVSQVTGTSSPSGSELTSVVPLDTSTASSVGGTLTTSTTNVLGTLDSNDLLSGDLAGLTSTLSL